MKNWIPAGAGVIAALGVYSQGVATYNATVTGTITIVQQDSGVLFTPETTIFQLFTQPTGGLHAPIFRNIPCHCTRRGDA